MISYKSSPLRAVSDNLVLALQVFHRFKEIGAVDRVVTRIPPEIDIYAAQTITFGLSGRLNGSKVPLQQLVSSQLARQLIGYFQTATLFSGSTYQLAS